MKLCWLSIYLFLLIACGRQSSAPTGNGAKQDLTEEQLDSIFEAFESVAYEQPEVYVHNPDSLFDNILVEPNTDYQKEMYSYGLIFMGYSLLEYGDNLESVKYYEKAYNYIKSNKVSVENINAEIIKPLANLYVRINDTQKSIALLRTALSESKDNDEVVGLSNNLANAYLYNSELDSAKKVLFWAMEIPTNTLSRALLYNTLASVYVEEQNGEQSKHYNNLALGNFEKNQLKGDTLLWYISALGLKGDLHQNNSYINRAVSLVEDNFPNAQNRFKAKLTLTNADLLRTQQNYPAALKAYESTLSYFNPEGRVYILDYTYTQALLGKANVFASQQQIDSALYYYEWAIENDFRTQQLIVSSKDQLRNNILNKQTIEDLITLVQSRSELRQEQKTIQQLLWCIELSKARLLINEINRSEGWINASAKTKTGIQTIRDIYYKIDATTDPHEKQKLTNRLKKVMVEFELSEKYFEALQFEPQKAEFLKQLNKSNSDFYTYFVHKDSCISIIYKSGQEFYFKKTLTATPLQRLVSFKEMYFGHTPNTYNSNPKEYHEKARYLKNELLPKIENAQRNIFISLDGQLYGFPFDALYDEDFLVKKHDFAYLNSFLLFEFLSNRTVPKSTIAILYRSEYPKPLPNLQFVDREVDNINGYFSAKRISPKQQNDSIIREQFSQSDIVHIAAHTILDSSAAPIIYLNQAISTNQLRFYEMKTPLVFLSACNTGHGRPLPSEGTESIQRVFLSKNVPSVISTFWFANDQTMLDLTTSFYKQLEKTADPIYALGEAKRNYLQSASPMQQNPWYWANINYTGIGNKIGLKKSSNLSYYIWGMIGLLAVTFRHPIKSWFYKALKYKNKKTYNKAK